MLTGAVSETSEGLEADKKKKKKGYEKKKRFNKMFRGKISMFESYFSRLAGNFRA